MAQYRIIIDLDNADFRDGDEGSAVALILRSLATHCATEECAAAATLRDSNGNTVGTATKS